MTNETDNLELMQGCDNFTRWQFDLIKPYLKGSVLEVGCGRGNLTKYLINSDEYFGVDINQDHVNYCYERFGPYFTMCNVGKPNFQGFDKPFDTIVLVNVLEHIEFDVIALDNIYKMLKPKGRLIIIVPQYPSIYNDIDRADNHYRRYTKKNLQKAISIVGFKTIHTSQFNMLGCVGWVKEKLFKKTTHESQHLNIFDKLVPLLRLYEDHMPKPFGLSILKVVTKGNE